MSVIKALQELAFVWETEDPFLFCVHHQDDYPEGNDEQGPSESLEGRNLGQDFDNHNSFRMYHGLKVPGFPEHPHRGFETVTITLEGTVDHFDSLGGSGRYSDGDIQWMTAGKGIQHCEMFPLVHSHKRNPLHLFQIWLNLPSKDKFVAPDYKMIWHENLEKIEQSDGGLSEITLITGSYGDATVLAPVDNSWGSIEENHVNIWLVKMAAEARLSLPNISATSHKNLYLYKGTKMSFNGETVESGRRLTLMNQEIEIINTGESAAFLYLEAEPIKEAVAKYGPFVMNTNEEIQQAYKDYQATQFGGWPWNQPDPVHARTQGRMAKYSDGTVTYPNNQKA